MLYKIFPIVIFSLILELSNGRANQEGPEQSFEKVKQPSKYERFLNRSGSFMLSKSYIVGEHKEGSSYSVEALSAWEMGSSEKIYAARFASVIVDFDELEGIQQELDKILQAVEKTGDKQAGASIRYKALNGLEFDYFVGQNSGVTVRLMLRGSLLAGYSMKSVVDLHTLVIQVREKLISLDAK